jgi:hypothetical protein
MLVNQELMCSHNAYLESFVLRYIYIIVRIYANVLVSCEPSYRWFDDACERRHIGPICTPFVLNKMCLNIVCSQGQAW